MKIAVVYQVPNPGGVTRFAHALIDGLLDADPTVTIDYFVADALITGNRMDLFDSIDRVRVIGISDPDVADSNIDAPRDSAVSSNPSMVRLAGKALLPWPRLRSLAAHGYDWVSPLLQHLVGKKTKSWQRFKLTSALESVLSGYDVVYLPFPYYLEPATINTTVVGTFHDVNHLYFPDNFGKRTLRLLDRQLRFWTARADAVVVSTEFVRQDLERHYPGSREKSNVVYVAPYSVRGVEEEARLSALARFGLQDRGFLIYPSNNSYHKNLLGVIQAADLVKRETGSLEYPLVFTGFGTDGLGTGRWHSFKDVDTFLESSSLVVGEDVRGLGFVTDVEVDALTRSARLVVSSSLYEAGCGPALDAWQFGVPVAFSQIPPFLEQLSALGVEAWVFDPHDPTSIRDVLVAALTNDEESSSMARRSKSAIAGYTWRDAGSAYLSVFGRAANSGRSRR